MSRTSIAVAWLVIPWMAGCSPEAGDSPEAEATRTASQDAERESGDVVARVGNRSVSISDLEASFPGRPRAAGPRALRPREARAVLERKIEGLLVEAEAEALGLTRDPEYLAERAALLSEAEDRARETLRRRLVERLSAEAEVTEAELREQMERMPRRFLTREIHVRRLVVDDEAAVRDAARRIVEGEPFADVSAEVSTDPELRSAGGDLGPQERSQLPPGVAARARALRSPGDVSEPFRAGGKWSLIELVAPPREVARPFEEVRPELEREVRSATAAQLLRQRLEERRVTLGVTIDEELLASLAEADPRAAPSPLAPTR